jgi:hypothetical protein
MIMRAWMASLSHDKCRGESRTGKGEDCWSVPECAFTFGLYTGITVGPRDG